MVKRVLIAILPVLILMAIPFLLRPQGKEAEPPSANADKLVIITAHNESIRYEYEQAFRRYYRNRFGKEVSLDFRTPGGTSDIVRYIADRFEAEFRREFESDPSNGSWNAEIADAFANPAMDNNPKASAVAKHARGLFLQSDIGIGIDLMAGGGTFDMARNASRGFAVDGGLQQRHPEYFNPEVIPQSFGGDNLYDKQGRYYGVVLSTFGICYNIDRVKELGDGAPPECWADLGEPRFYNTLSLADPSKSGSVNKCFEILIQQCMADATNPDVGWEVGLNLVKRIFANACSLTDSAGKIPHDVSTGNAAAGVAIDSYGLMEEEWNELQFKGEKHFFYVPPKGGTAISADPIQLLRGAPHRQVAEAFLDFILSKEGQLIHPLKVGTPGGPLRHALRRPPIRRDLYGSEYLPYRTDPYYNPYESGANFVYRPQWTAPYYSLIRIVIKCIALEPQTELQQAWKAIIDAGGPDKVPEAMEVFNRIPFPYQQIQDANLLIRKNKDRTAVDVAATCRAWSEEARNNYLKAKQLAKERR